MIMARHIARYLFPALALAAACMPLYAQDGEEAQQAPVVVKLHWPEMDLTNAQVRVARDARFQDLVGAFPSGGPSGRLLMFVEPGSYYMMAVVDVDGDGKMSPGDGLGFYGVLDPLGGQEPAPVEVGGDGLEVNIVIALRLNEEGQLEPTGVKEPEKHQAAVAVTVKGRLVGRAPTGTAVVYMVPRDGVGRLQVWLPGEEGNFEFNVPGGEYYLFAVQDINESRNVDTGDLFAVWGYEPEMEKQFPAPEFDRDLEDIELVLDLQIQEDGLLTALEGEGHGPQVAVATLPAVIYGAVQAPPDTTIARLAAKATGDPGLRHTVGFQWGSAQRFFVGVPTGTYFVAVWADVDGDGMPGKGDWQGFLGVDGDGPADGPQPVYLRPGDIRPLNIALTQQMTAPTTENNAENAGN